MLASLKVIKTSDGVIESIELLEKLLVQAKAGDFTCFAFVAVQDPGAVVSGWSTPPLGNHVRLVGALSYLQHRMNQCLEESE